MLFHLHEDFYSLTANRRKKHNSGRREETRESHLHHDSLSQSVFGFSWSRKKEQQEIAGRKKEAEHKSTFHLTKRWRKEWQIFCNVMFMHFSIWNRRHVFPKISKSISQEDLSDSPGWQDLEEGEKINTALLSFLSDWNHDSWSMQLLSLFSSPYSWSNQWECVVEFVWIPKHSISSTCEQTQANGMRTSLSYSGASERS